MLQLSFRLQTILIYDAIHPNPTRRLDAAPIRMSPPRARRLFPSLLLAAGLVLPGLASAHSLLLNCRPAPDNMVQCKGEFSDGSDAAGMGITVQAYDERVLNKGSLNGESAWSFRRPEGEFFVRLEDGVEHSVEVDHSDVKP